MLLLKNKFGHCIDGNHSSLIDEHHGNRPFEVAMVHHVTFSDFYKIENLGIECKPKCGGCKCGRCAIGGNNYTLKEERELKLIEDNLTYDVENHRWIAEYPWIKDPANLPNNRNIAMARLISTERRLAKNPDHTKIYDQQIEDMIQRNVARKLTTVELESHKGPYYYICHHEVLKPDSKTTPVRIVFNSSANYMGHVLNDYWAKGPDLLNSLLGILIRFRENKIGFIGNIRKMYHTVHTTDLEQHTHRFLWRNMEPTRKPDTYVIQRVSFVDKPSGSIATVVLRKTEEMGQSDHPEATKIIKENSYMDDIIDSVNNKEKALQLTKKIGILLKKGGFDMKEWIYSKTQDNTTDKELNQTATEKVLAISWKQSSDELRFKITLNLIPKRKRKSQAEAILKDPQENLTKRMVLSQVNSLYDPLGLAGPFTARAKILMRELWVNQPEKGWDESIPKEKKHKWMKFFDDLHDMNTITSKRCVKADDSIADPMLVIFSDGSKDAHGACAFIRWELPNGKFESHLLLSKNRLAPVRGMSIDCIELCGAILNKRLKDVIQTECRYNFQRFYHIVDSQIVYAMIHKENYGFNTFAATRVGEIHEGTNVDDWYWIPSQYNVADWLTRGKSPFELKNNSIWQNGPEFLEHPEAEWPVNRSIVMHATTLINIDRFSNYTKLLKVTARVLAMYKKRPKPSF